MGSTPSTRTNSFGKKNDDNLLEILVGRLSLDPADSRIRRLGSFLSVRFHYFRLNRSSFAGIAQVVIIYTILDFVLIFACVRFIVVNERTIGERLVLLHRIRAMGIDRAWKAALTGKIDEFKAKSAEIYELYEKVSYEKHRNALFLMQDPEKLYPKELIEALDKYENPDKYPKDNVVSMKDYKVKH